MSDEDDFDLLQKLRNLLNIEAVIAYCQGLIADKLMGPKEKRIGIFGPFEPEFNSEVIKEIMKMVASMGFVAYSGLGYIKPGESEIKSIDPLWPPIIKEIFKRMIPPTRRWHVFPRVGSKAIINLYPTRTNFIELEGCVEANIPVLGFVLREDIYVEDSFRNCDYLKYNQESSICQAPEIAYCRYTRFCPFISNPVALPESARECFIGNEKNELVAIREVRNLKCLIENFLHS